MNKVIHNSYKIHNKSYIIGGNPGLIWVYSQVALVVKSPPADAGDTGLIPGSGRYLGGGNTNPLQYFAWKIPWTEEPGRLQSIGTFKAGGAGAPGGQGTVITEEIWSFSQA